jgi:hypothetical protein
MCCSSLGAKNYEERGREREKDLSWNDLIKLQ